MKTLLVLVCGLAAIGGSFAQGMGDDDKNKQDQQDMWKKPGPAKDDLLEKMVGKWKGEGKVWDKDFKVELEAKWTLNHQFVEETSKWLSSDKSADMEGRGLFQSKRKNGKRKVLWLDDFGEASVAEGTETKTGLTLSWCEKTEEGEMEMRLDFNFDDKGWNEEFFMKQGDKWVPSGKITYTKAK